MSASSSWRKLMKRDAAVPDAPMEDDNPYRDYVQNSLIASPRTDRQSASVVQIESNKLIPLVLVLVVVAVVFGVYASEKAERAMDAARAMDASVAERQRLTERETRIMQDDLKYVRSYLSARGINIPANHEEAEENSK